MTDQQRDLFGPLHVYEIQPRRDQLLAEAARLVRTVRIAVAVWTALALGVALGVLVVLLRG
ncbi:MULTISPECIES: hypothetical protein [Actinomadura]|uniref:Uncharacterized protein n=1 Tax=Actinomadura yumaensis TaxID=111807 RepID=A0ABW2CTZ3_9ACTN|nr:hypothetical protein [Actinomadura sp. J1-007]MWK39546.1 hypothetical protein [Actinomadura sp. J1-007]